MQRMLILWLALVFSSAYAIPLDQIKTKPNPGTVVLTFDDGPNPIYTPQIIDILNKYHIHAVFFVMGGFAKMYPNLLKLINDNGDVVANHTMTHPMLTKISPKNYEYQILGVNKIVEKAIGKTPLCVRPPFGMVNNQVREYIRSQGMQVIMWDWNSFDYNKPGVDKIVSNVLNNTRSGYDILLHDGPKAREQTVAALPLIIEGLKKKGLGFDLICQG